MTRPSRSIRQFPMPYRRYRQTSRERRISQADGCVDWRVRAERAEVRQLAVDRMGKHKRGANAQGIYSSRGPTGQFAGLELFQLRMSRGRLRLYHHSIRRRFRESIFPPINAQSAIENIASILFAAT
jgi:hypothetical protein